MIKPTFSESNPFFQISVAYDSMLLSGQLFMNFQPFFMYNYKIHRQP